MKGLLAQLRQTREIASGLHALRQLGPGLGRGLHPFGIAQLFVGGDGLHPGQSGIACQSQHRRRDIGLHCLKATRFHARSQRRGEQRQHVEADHRFELELITMTGAQIADAGIGQRPGTHQFGLRDAQFGIADLQTGVVEQGDLHRILDRQRLRAQTIQRCVRSDRRSGCWRCRCCSGCSGCSGCRNRLTGDGFIQPFARHLLDGSETIIAGHTDTGRQQQTDQGHAEQAQAG